MENILSELSTHHQVRHPLLDNMSPFIPYQVKQIRIRVNMAKNRCLESEFLTGNHFFSQLQTHEKTENIFLYVRLSQTKTQTKTNKERDEGGQLNQQFLHKTLVHGCAHFSRNKIYSSLHCRRLIWAS